MKNVAIIIAVLSLQNIFSQVNLTDTTNQYDYIIITVPEFVSACEVFAQHKENVRDFKTLIVDTTMILNEFNSNTMIQDNIRDFISYAGTFWESPQPKYFLFAGNLNAIPNYDFISFPGYPETDTAKSDFKYSVSKYSQDTSEVSFFVGRIAASNQTELNNYFNKVIEYESDENLYEWNNNALVIADDEFSGGGYEGNIWYNMSLGLINAMPGYIDKKFISSSDTSIFFGNKDSIINYINNIGSSSVFFIGHGNQYQFTHESLFTIDDIDLIQNGVKYFVMYYLSLQYFTDSITTSIFDKLLFSDDGAIAGISPVGLHFAGPNNEYLLRHGSNLYSPNKISIGEIHRIAVFTSTASSRRFYNIFGDPSLKLKYDVTVDVKPISSFPTEYSLEQNYPNPFNPSTTIKFSIPVPGNVELKVYSVLGKEIKILTDRFYNSGNHEIEFDAGSLSSGVYFYTISSGDFHQTRKMILMK